jgi:hypothetical protein
LNLTFESGEAAGDHAASDIDTVVTLVTFPDLLSSVNHELGPFVCTTQHLDCEWQFRAWWNPPIPDVSQSSNEHSGVPLRFSIPALTPSQVEAVGGRVTLSEVTNIDPVASDVHFADGQIGQLRLR